MRSAISSSSAIASSAAVVVTVASRTFSSTATLRQNERIFFNNYQDQTFKHIQAMKKNTTYPGSIRAATPGDTIHYQGHPTAIKLAKGDRHYWRPVVDDAFVEDKVTLRVRVKDNVWVSTKWETRMQTIEVVLDRSATIADLMKEIKTVNAHPHLLRNPFILLLDDKHLSPTTKISEADLSEFSALYAVDMTANHIEHLPEGQLKDYHVDEITEADFRNTDERYRDWGIHTHEGNTKGKPRYQSVPSKVFNFGRF